MAESTKKTGFFGKFLNVLSGKPAADNEPEKEEQPLFSGTKKESTDVAFVKNFTASGGKFLYCENEKDAYEYLQNIMRESGLKAIFCKDPNLISILSKAGLSTGVTDNLSQADAFCSACEYLISFNGGIMITANQTLGKKLIELPETFITVARTSQIMENLREGLTGIRNKYKGDIPSQITTIKGPVKDAGREENSSASTCNKEIYLLLIEDQL
jgi:L-lactate utilization protein LutB